MCEKCEQLDRQLEYVRRMIEPALEPLGIGLLRVTLADLEEERAAFKCPELSWRSSSEQASVLRDCSGTGMPCSDRNPMANDKQIVVERQDAPAPPRIARKVTDDPPAYRVWYDGVEVG